MDPRSLKQFVMFRVGEVLESTNVTQWRWVPSKENPADLATKPSSKSMQLWLDGPQFLRQPMATWPTCEDLSGGCKEEIRREWVQYHKKCDTVPIAFDYFSNWKSLYRSVVNFLLYMNKLRKIPTTNIQRSELVSHAKNFIIRQVQLEAF